MVRRNNFDYNCKAWRDSKKVWYLHPSPKPTDSGYMFFGQRLNRHERSQIRAAIAKELGRREYYDFPDQHVREYRAILLNIYIAKGLILQ